MDVAEVSPTPIGAHFLCCDAGLAGLTDPQTCGNTCERPGAGTCSLPSLNDSSMTNSLAARLPSMAESPGTGSRPAWTAQSLPSSYAPLFYRPSNETSTHGMTGVANRFHPSATQTQTGPASKSSRSQILGRGRGLRSR
ncbi:hypothetical protein B0T16DRAFT_181726 [Cercophora newfieldiana]|uniref:Uncharacterized protein n=1 Tax=Cercophora newfieldiana TaxID=92897 RepID=A0AA39Y047_9PEZI|nr:hypothetical protein B0T16DRAFT_181726 [Cercophora newfieldiana]